VFFLELLSAVQPRVVNWKVVTKGEAGPFLVHMCYFMNWFTLMMLLAIKKIKHHNIG
jgi:hypothetical protein